MSDWFNHLMTQLMTTSAWEWGAVILAIAYILLAMRESLWCWPAAFISTAIYTVLFFDVNLYMESLLNLYYLAMAIYGWYQWRQGESGEERSIVEWPMKYHLSAIIALTGGVLLCGSLLQTYTNQSFAFLDSFTTWFAIFATYLLTQKVLANWLYWVVIDAVSIYLYTQKGLLLTAILFSGYTMMALLGWREWKLHFERHATT